jgi:hypothetical protein
LANDVSFKAIEENLFVIKFFYLGDWRKVMDEGPWIFRGHAVLLEEYDGITKPSKMKFKNLNVWVRIYDLPTGFRTNKNIGRQLGKFLILAQGVKYEKLPKFCAVCGLLGHIESECADGMHDKKNF